MGLENRLCLQPALTVSARHAYLWPCRTPTKNSLKDMTILIPASLRSQTRRIRSVTFADGRESVNASVRKAELYSLPYDEPLRLTLRRIRRSTGVNAAVGLFSTAR